MMAQQQLRFGNDRGRKAEVSRLKAVQD